MFSFHFLHLWPLIPGMLLPAINGWLLLKILEWKTPVLMQAERWCLGLFLGLTVTMYLTFLSHILGWIDLNRWGFFMIQIGTIVILGIICMFCRSFQLSAFGTSNEQRSRKILPIWLKIVFILLGIWTIIKVCIAGITFSILTPLFLDDTIDNWNLRGKIFFVDQKLTLILPGQSQDTLYSSVSSYPPTVPLVKTYLASILGSWDESLINSIHFMWFLLVLALVYLFLKRLLSPIWGLLGIYVLASLPLYLLHGTNAYADVFLSGHVFAAAILLFFSAQEQDDEKKASFLRLAVLPLVLLPFTKNEGLLLYFPPLILMSIILILKNKRHFLSLCTLYTVSTLSVLVPWLLFKWSNGLSFGNAKSLNDFGDIAWQAGVLPSIFLNTFFIGNWLLLFFVFFGLIAWKWRTALRSPLVVLVSFFFVVYLGQISLYLFTGLSIEAVKQTGYARGIVHLVPVVVVITVMLLEKIISNMRR